MSDSPLPTVFDGEAIVGFPCVLLNYGNGRDVFLSRFQSPVENEGGVESSGKKHRRASVIGNFVDGRRKSGQEFGVEVSSAMDFGIGKTEAEHAPGI